MKNKYKRIEYSNENFRKNINYLIERDKITKNILDKYLEIGEGSLSRYCKLDDYAIEPKIGIINSLAKAFGVTIDDLINENIEEKEKQSLKNSERKDVLFCKKLIEQTKENMCKWENLDINNDSHINIEYCDYGDYGYYISNFFNNEGEFESRFSYELYEMNNIKGFIVTINRNIKVLLIELIVKLDMDKELDFGNIAFNYELYLIKESGEVIPGCSSYRHTNKDLKLLGEEILYDEVFDNVLKELYKVVADYVAFGKDNFEKDSIYDEYLLEKVLDDISF